MPATPALFRRTAASAVGVLLVTGLAACGSNNATTGAGDNATPATGSTAASSPTTVDAGQNPGQSLTADQMAAIIKTGVGAIDTAHETLSMDSSAAGRSVQMHAEADVRMNPLAMTMTMQTGTLNIQEMFIDGSMYMKMPGMPTGGKWIKVDLKQMSSLMGGNTLSDALTNPLGVMDKMTAYITKASYVGEDSVNGTSAKHYRMTIDLKAAMAKLAPNLPSAATSGIGTSADEDIWVDSAGRAVKTVANFGTGTMTTTLSDFGKPVDIQAPPASQVTAMPGMGGLGG